MDAQAYMAERASLLDAWLEDFVPPADEPPVALHGAMRHLLLPGGKRLRPAFAMAAAEALGAPATAVLPVAAAVELVHTYSLVHDDLPCMDDDTTRRGLPTVHVAYDEATAVLAGDALQALAFEAAAAGAPPGVAAALLADLARAVGSRGLVGGQADDVAADKEGVAPGEAALESIHARKSASLIAVSIVSGARVAGADEALLARMEAFGRAVGVAFQIADDCLDGDGLAALVGTERAMRRAETLLEDALEIVRELGERAEPLRELSRFAVRRSQ